jgi:hypothetical protein
LLCLGNLGRLDDETGRRVEPDLDLEDAPRDLALRSV